MKPKRILVVVDNDLDFRDTTQLFECLPHLWEVHISQSQSDALVCLRQSEFDLVFADLKAGPRAGAEFLHDVWERHPGTIRFLLGPEMTPDLIVSCAAGMHQFLQKPLEPTLLEAALDRAEIVQILLRDGRVKELVSRIRVLPSRPRIYFDLLRELRSENGSIQTVTELVSADPGISTKLLQVVNSAFFGLEQKVVSPSDAVLFLGTETTASLVLAIQIFAELDKLKPAYFVLDQVWRHSQSVAQKAGEIAVHSCESSKVAQQAFVSGLLHDIGKLALAINMHEDYGSILRLARQKRTPVWKAELEVLGTTHASVGGYLMALWGMPAAIVQAVAAHHAPASALPLEFSATSAVHVANMLEYAKLPLKNTFPDLQLDLNYPEELCLEPFVVPLRGGHSHLNNSIAIA